MHLPPMLAALTRHKFIVLLMIATTSLTSAVITNVAVMIVHRLALLQSPSGIQESTLVTVDSSNFYGQQSGGTLPEQDHLAQYRADVAALRGIEGVEAAASVSGLPFEGGMGINISRVPDVNQGFQVTAFIGGEGVLKALGLHLVQGRDFLDSEYLPSGNMSNFNKVSAAIVSRDLANHLFHTSKPVGQLFYLSGHPIQVVGVVDHLMNMSPQLDAPDNEDAMLLPLEPDGDYVTFALSTLPLSRDRVLQRAVAVLGGRNFTRVLDNAKPFSQSRMEYFQRENSMVNILLAAGVALLIVTVAGIMGLVSFWVQQRTHSIGIRRALGATRSNILNYFLIENFLIITIGVLLGCLLAKALNLLLIRHFEVQALPSGYLIVGAFSLWLTGQVAGLSPALRAASVPPVVATRSI